MKKIIVLFSALVLISCKKEEKQTEVSSQQADTIQPQAEVTFRDAMVSNNTDSISHDTKVDLSKSLTKAEKATKEEMKQKVEELKNMKPTEKRKLVDVLPKSIFGMPVEVGKEIIFEGVPNYPSAEGFYVNKNNIDKHVQLYIVDVGGTADVTWKIKDFYKKYNGELDKTLPSYMEIYHEDINGMKSVITKTTKDGIDYYSSNSIVKDRYTVDIVGKGFTKADLVKIISNLDFSGLD